MTLLALSLSLAMTLQAPQGPNGMKPWVDLESDPARPRCHGGAGHAGAGSEGGLGLRDEPLRERRQEQLRTYAERRIAALSPSWFPDLMRDRVLRSWLGKQAPTRGVEVLDRDLVVRDHGFGRSYQGFLLVREPGMELAGRRLVRQLEVAQRQLIQRGVLVLGVWSSLALILIWLDRLTRGYMTRRLMLLGIGLGTAAPALLVLL